MNAEDSIFGTPLVAAARGGHTEVVAALLRKEEVLLDQHSQRDTPLTAAVNGGHLECAQMLLERGTAAGKALARIPQLPDDGEVRARPQDAERRPPHPGVQEGRRRPRQAPAAARLGRDGRRGGHVRHAADRRRRERPRALPEGGDGRGRRRGRGGRMGRSNRSRRRGEIDSPSALECCEILLEGGADPNFVSSGVVGRRLGYGAVHAAAARMDAAMVKMLIASGADPDRRAKNTDTKEVKSRRAAAAQALWGPDVAGQRLDNTPLHLAVAAYINEAAKRRVVENAKKRAEGGDSDDGDDDAEDDSALDENERFDTPAERRRRRNLHARAMDQGEPGPGEMAAMRVIETLLDCGADHGAFVVDSTPMHMAALGGALDVVDLLVEHGADVNACAPNGCTTPIEAAARYAADIVVDFAEERDELSKPVTGKSGSGSNKQNKDSSRHSPRSDDSAETTEPTTKRRARSIDASDDDDDDDDDELRAFRDDAAAMEALRDAAGPLTSGETPRG